MVCTIRDHARVHYIRYRVYDNIIDYAAYKGLCGKTDELVTLINEKRIATSKARKVLFWNPEFQYIQSKKTKKRYFLRENPDRAAEYARLGGIASGLIWTEKKLESSRKKGKVLGKKFGRTGGLKAQGEKTKAQLQKNIKWKHRSGKTTETVNFEAVADVVDHLNSIVPDSLRFKNSLSAVLRGVEKSRGGWSIESTEETNESTKLQINTTDNSTEAISITTSEINQIINEINNF